MRVMEFSAYRGTVRIPSCWTAFRIDGKTYDIVGGIIRLRRDEPPAKATHKAKPHSLVGVK
jgi:hypothetical protein